MIGRAPTVALTIVALVAAVAAFAAGGDLGTALPLALLATGASAAVAGIALADRLRPPRPDEAPVDPPPSVVVLDGLVGGAFARQEVIHHLQVLERRFASRLVPVGAEEEARLLKLSHREFLRWVTERVSYLEGSS